MIIGLRHPALARGGETTTTEIRVIRSRLSAALAVAKRLGLDVERPVVLHESNNVVAWLAPSGVVVKIGVGHHDRLQEELAAGAYLARTSAPVVGPAPEIPAEVYTEAGLPMTFWRYQPQRGSDAPSAAVAAALSALHTGLERYGVETDATPPSYTEEALTLAERLADQSFAPRLRLADRRLLARALDRLADKLADGPITEALLHGSPHRSNIICVDERPYFIDFETVSVGPIEWDLAHLEPEVAETYPGDVDAGTLALCRLLVSAKTAAWCWAGFDRPAELRWHARHHLGVIKRAGI